MAFTRVRGKGAAPVFLLVIIAAIAFAVGYLLALVLRFAISRRREYQADAGSVDLTKDPDALISALLKIARNPDVPHVPSEVRQMFIENPPSGLDLGGLFATHPPIAKRIQVLEELGGHVPNDLSSSSAAPTSAGPSHVARLPDSSRPGSESCSVRRLFDQRTRAVQMLFRNKANQKTSDLRKAWNLRGVRAQFALSVFNADAFSPGNRPTCTTLCLREII